MGLGSGYSLKDGRVVAVSSDIESLRFNAHAELRAAAGELQIMVNRLAVGECSWPPVHEAVARVDRALDALVRLDQREGIAVAAPEVK